MTAQQDRPASTRPSGLPGKLGEYRAFLAGAVRNPQKVGAATPTSAAVAGVVAQVVPTTGQPVVLELGPGTGSLSGGIRERLPAGARHVGIELVDEMVRHLRVHAPWMELVHGDAGDLVPLLAERGVDQVDAVISSLPWSLLGEADQDRILGEVTKVLAPHGAFTALTYLPAEHNTGGRRFRQRLAATFDEVITHTTWRNFPPILHYICRRPLL
ncbi:class I SAM-dependent methyltransferase [Saccharopolyspora gregorii]|uniref:class I SAM-dependent methyltransferase n=1 Tax=Saccharopolyspora gregorii TaxID=33914 RepID=UPI0021AD127E|nr:methyltransferase domain-containing protein [Saccharopolyspora gregorii]